MLLAGMSGNLPGQRTRAAIACLAQRPELAGPFANDGRLHRTGLYRTSAVPEQQAALVEIKIKAQQKGLTIEFGGLNCVRGFVKNFIKHIWFKCSGTG